MSNQDRPLSPHMSVYRWPITMTLSILHRLTGAGLSLGFVVLALWLSSASSGKEPYTETIDLLSSTVGRLVLIALLFSFFFHFCNGVRHLVWDTGRGFERQQSNVSAGLVIVMTVVLSFVFWLFV